MGTGVVGILLDTIPFKARWLYHLSIVFFILNTIIFFAALFVSIVRYSIWPEIWGVMIQV
jgi:tellurite resistance protein TehA-like permease